MVHAAMRLFQRQGYEATTWREIAASGEAPTGSIAFLFPGGKEELGVAAVRASADRTLQRLTEVVGQGGPVVDAVQASVRAAAAAFAASGFSAGCPLATVALEMSHRSPAIRQAADDGFASWRHALAEGLRPELGDAAEDAAVIFLSAFEGALLLARASRTTRPLDALADRIPALLGALAPAPPAPA